MMNPGRYRYLIEFLIQSIGQDDYGQPIDEWNVFKTAYASKNPILGNEFYTALTTDSKVEIKFNCRYISGITNEMRIRHGTNIYEILSSIDVNSLHEELLCYCSEVK